MSTLELSSLLPSPRSPTSSTRALRVARAKGVQNWSPKPSPPRSCCGLSKSSILVTSCAVVVVVCATALAIAVAAISVVNTTNGGVGSSGSSGSSGSGGSGGSGTNTGPINGSNNTTGGGGSGGSGNNNGPVVTSPYHTEFMAALGTIGAPCNALTGTGCNPGQIPLQDSSAYKPLAPVASFTESNVDDLLEYNKQVRGFKLTTNKGIITSMQDFSTATSNSFGLGATVPISSVSFGGSYGAKQTFSSMYSSSTATYYANLQALATLYSVYVRPGKVVTAVPGMSDDITTMAASRDLDAWKAFVMKYGTHYVSQITYGGIINAQNKMTYDKSTSLTSWSTSQTETLKLGFSSFLGLDASHSSSSKQAKEQAQQEWSQSVTLTVRGGDESLALNVESGAKNQGSPVQSWLESVNSTTAVIINTQLASIATLFPADEQSTAKTMLGQLMRTCPGTEAAGGDWLGCSGIGRCVFSSSEASYCQCPAAYVGAACNASRPCEPACVSGVCDHGTGKCKCHANYMGASCDTPCGVKNFPTGSNTVWASIGGHDGSYDDDSATLQTPARTNALDCVCDTVMPSWARSTTGGYWSSGTMNNVNTAGKSDVTYPCLRKSCTDVWGCNFFTRFSCAYNTAQPTCPTA